MPADSRKRYNAGIALSYLGFAMMFTAIPLLFTGLTLVSLGLMLPVYICSKIMIGSTALEVTSLSSGIAVYEDASKKDIKENKKVLLTNLGFFHDKAVDIYNHNQPLEAEDPNNQPVI